MFNRREKIKHILYFFLKYYISKNLISKKVYLIKNEILLTLNVTKKMVLTSKIKVKLVFGPLIFIFYSIWSFKKKLIQLDLLIFKHVQLGLDHHFCLNH